MTMYVTPSGKIYLNIKFCIRGCRQCDPEQREELDFCSVCEKNIVQSEDEAKQIAVSIETAKREAARREAEQREAEQREAARLEAEQREAIVLSLVNESKSFSLSPLSDITNEELFTRINKYKNLFVKYQKNDPLLIEKINKIFQFQLRVIYFAEFAKSLENRKSENWDDFHEKLDKEKSYVKEFILKFWPKKPLPIPPRCSGKKKSNDSKISRMLGEQTTKLAKIFGKQVKLAKSSGI